MTSRHFRSLFPVALAALLSACGGGAASNESGTSANAGTITLAEQIRSLEASGQLPKLDRSVDIRGPDNVSKPNNQQGYGLIDKIEALTANTRERAKQYLAYNRARSDSVTELPAGNTCEC